MSPAFSLYLHALRVVAALVVLFRHANRSFLTDSTMPMTAFDTDALMTFFVLSGFVIAYVVHEREKDFRSYALSRLSRVYSVALLAIILIPIFGYFGMQWNADVYAGFTPPAILQPDWTLDRLFFMLHLDFDMVRPFSNPPYWTLNYEVWYYVLFAVFMFVPQKIGWFWGVVISLCAVYLVGLKIALLLPVWMVGVLSFHMTRWIKPSFSAGLALLFVSLIAYALYRSLRIYDMGTEWTDALLPSELAYNLWWSRNFLSDYIFALILGVHFIAMTAVFAPIKKVPDILVRVMHFFSERTYTLYLFHFPLILFFAALVDGEPTDPLYVWKILTCVVVVSLILAEMGERRRKSFYRLFEMLFEWVSKLTRRRRTVK